MIEQDRAVIELDREEIRRRELLLRLQVVADLARACAEIDAAVADMGEVGTVEIERARIRGPDAARLRVRQARILAGIEPAAPAGIGFAPVGRQLRIVAAEPARDTARERPANVAAAIADREVLHRHAGLIGCLYRFVYRLGDVEVQQFEIRAARLQRGPREG